LGLEADAALRFALGEDPDLVGERYTTEGAQERHRVGVYLELLSREELERRAEVDYVAEYAEMSGDERVEPADCPVRGLTALLPSGFDSLLGEMPWGTCVACSYSKSPEFVDFEAYDAALRRAIADPRS
jgi:hypothetical protein